MDNLRIDLMKIHEYMLSLATHKVTPTLIPPADLRSILTDVETKLRANPKLALPVTEKADIWSYYQFLKINAFVHCDMLIVVLILPLIDRDLEFDLFKAHSLPLLHPKLKKVFSYEIDNPYIAIQSDGNYLTIPIHDDILTCTISAGHFCNLNTPLYPTKTTTKCTYHLLVNDKEKIQEFCKINIQNYAQDTVINLDQNIWALAVLEPTELHVSCLTYSYQIKIESSFKLIELDNSCQAYNPNFILPSSNLIKEKLNQSLITDRFFNYDLKYTSIPNFFLMNTFNITKLTQEQLDTLAYDLPPVCNIPFRNVTSMLKPIDKNYPFIFPTYGYVLLTIGGTTLTIMVIGILYYAKYKRARAGAAPSK